jgi:hypothetical protein
VRVDFATQQRTIKDSGDLLAELAGSGAPRSSG